MKDTHPRLIGSSRFTERLRDLEDRVKRQKINTSPNSGIKVTETSNGTVIERSYKSGGGGGSIVPRWG